PQGFELAEVTGNTLDSSEVQSGVLVLRVRAGSGRAHQFLISIERASKENKLDVPFLAFENAQRETGELLVEGVGTMELTAAESGGLRRIDVREAQPVARSLARFPLQAAFRYQNRQSDAPKLQLEWNEFPDSSVISAIAEEGTVTTLLNAEGKSLTEVSLKVRNHAQPFMKVDLPQGATLLSAEVDGEGVKPVLGTDGTRVPLLRAGLRPTGAYTVSFVYLNSGAALAKNGSYQMILPKLDIPVSILTWEVSLPDRLEVRQFGGTAFASTLVPPGTLDTLYASEEEPLNGRDIGDLVQLSRGVMGPSKGQIGGIVVDASGAVIPGADVKVLNKQTGETLETRANSEGRFLVAGMQPGAVEVTVESSGFKNYKQELNLESDEPARLGIRMEVGAVSEAVIVTSGSEETILPESKKLDAQSRKTKQADQAQALNPSANVFNLQRKVAGILPVRMEVPKAGRSYKFIRPLVLDEETDITFQYKLK
ncbi:MAG TPA: carboxypeptidase-like regulatory domain-containing protein, partial [Blastocatellia bacterium]|nr:carboxypeptidase-like regulatory domain-containing protein [Blastocatellia bacterium]